MSDPIPELSSTCGSIWGEERTLTSPCDLETCAHTRTSTHSAQFSTLCHSQPTSAEYLELAPDSYFVLQVIFFLHSPILSFPPLQFILDTIATNYSF